MSKFKILDSVDYVLDIPTNPEELATLLDSYALDWGTVLNFIDAVATRRGISIDRERVCEIMIRKYGEI